MNANLYCRLWFQKALMSFTVPSTAAKAQRSKPVWNTLKNMAIPTFLQVDADSQHCLSDTPKLLAAAEQNPEAVVCGWPQYGNDAPKSTTLRTQNYRLLEYAAHLVMRHQRRHVRLPPLSAYTRAIRCPRRNCRRPHGLRYRNPYPPLLARCQTGLD